MDYLDLLNSSPDEFNRDDWGSRGSGSPEDELSFQGSESSSSPHSEPAVGVPSGYISRERRSAIVFDQKAVAKDKDTTNWKPIVVKDPADRKAVRRARNTESARRSRAKKNEKIEVLQQLVDDLQARNKELEIENSILKKFVPSNI